MIAVYDVYPQHCPQCLTKLLPPSPVERPICGCCLQPTATVFLKEADLCNACCAAYFNHKLKGLENSFATIAKFARPPRQTRFDFTKYSGWILGGWAE